MPPPHTLDDLVALRGLIMLDGSPVTREPTADEPLPICAGPWPYPIRGGRQYRCHVCQAIVGLGPESQTLHNENPLGRQIFCAPCFLLFTNAYEAYFKAL